MMVCYRAIINYSEEFFMTWKNNDRLLCYMRRANYNSKNI